MNRQYIPPEIIEKIAYATYRQDIYNFALTCYTAWECFLKYIIDELCFEEFYSVINYSEIINNNNKIFKRERYYNIEDYLNLTEDDKIFLEEQRQNIIKIVRNKKYLVNSISIPGVDSEIYDYIFKNKKWLAYFQNISTLNESTWSLFPQVEPFMLKLPKLNNIEVNNCKISKDFNQLNIKNIYISHSNFIRNFIYIQNLKNTLKNLIIFNNYEIRHRRCIRIPSNGIDRVSLLYFELKKKFKENKNLPLLDLPKLKKLYLAYFSYNPLFNHSIFTHINLTHLYINLSYKDYNITSCYNYHKLYNIDKWNYNYNYNKEFAGYEEFMNGISKLKNLKFLAINSYYNEYQYSGKIYPINPFILANKINKLYNLKTLCVNSMIYLNSNFKNILFKNNKIIEKLIIFDDNYELGDIYKSEQYEIIEEEKELIEYFIKYYNFDKKILNTNIRKINVYFDANDNLYNLNLGLLSKLETDVKNKIDIKIKNFEGKFDRLIEKKFRI